MTLATTPHSQPTAPTARPPLANQPEVRCCLQPAHQSNWNGVAAGLSTTSGFISTHTGLQSFNRYSYCTNNPLKYTDLSGYRRKPSGWYLPWVALNGGISPGGRMDPGSGKHWSDCFRGEWGNFMLGNQGTYDGMYGQGAYSNFVNNVYPKEKKQTSHDDRLLMHFVGFKWNPVGSVEVERGGTDSDLRIYCSGSWQKKDGKRGEDDLQGQGGDLATWSFIAGAASLGYDSWQNLAYDGYNYLPSKGPNAGKPTCVWKMNKSGNFALKNGTDFVMGGLAYVPGWGWAVSGGYFIGKACNEIYPSIPADYWGRPGTGFSR